MPDHELVIRITAPTASDGEHWATTIRDLVTAEHGHHMRLAFDGPRLVNAPGSTVEQLPDHLRALVELHTSSYLSTACEAGGALGSLGLARQVPETADLPEWEARMHQRCRLNHKFTGAPCVCRCHQEAGR